MAIKGQKYFDAAKKLSPGEVLKKFAELSGPEALAISDKEADIAQKKDELHKLVVSGNTSIIATNSAPAEGLNKEAEEKKREDLRWAFARKLLQDAIDQKCRELENMAAEYGKMAAWHRQQAEEQRLLMEQAVRDMEDAQKKREEIAGILDDAKSNGKVDRERARRFLAGMDVTFPDDASDAEILALLREADKALLREADKALQEKQSEASARHDTAKDKAENHLSEAEELEKKAREMLAERDRILEEKGTSKEANEELTKLCEKNKEVLENKEKIKDEKTKYDLGELEQNLITQNTKSPDPKTGSLKTYDLS